MTVPRNDGVRQVAPTEKEHPMTDPVSRLVEAIDRKDAQGIRDALAPDVRFAGMVPENFYLMDGADTVAAKLADWYASWEEDPSYAFIGRVQDGDRVVVEFERTSTCEGEPWVVRQVHVMRVSDLGIEELRVYCCGPRQGEPELAAAYAGSAS
jgi:ketosteroid isomerase-like protein